VTADKSVEEVKHKGRPRRVACIFVNNCHVKKEKSRLCDRVKRNPSDGRQEKTKGKHCVMSGTLSPHGSVTLLVRVSVDRRALPHIKPKQYRCDQESVPRSIPTSTACAYTASTSENREYHLTSPICRTVYSYSYHDSGLKVSLKA
jgi:hypothetical protein